MKAYLCFVVIALFVLSCSREKDCPEEVNEVIEETVEEAGYDSLYAEQLGADEYGMKPYVMAFLKAGPNRDQDSAQAAELQRAHLDNINRLAEEGKLVLAGPFYGEEAGELRGIYIFDVSTVEEAEELTKTDPAIQQGRLVMDLIPWYGSAAVMEINSIHNKIAKTDV